MITARGQQFSLRMIIFIKIKILLLHAILEYREAAALYVVRGQVK